MNGMKMFNAMANVDRELLDNSAAPAGQKRTKTARSGSAWVRWITLTASFLLCAGLVIGICVMVNNRTKNGNRSGETDNSDPYSKYYGLWVKDTFSAAIQFCENQKYYYYLLNNEDPLKYDFKYSGTYSIEDDVLLWYPDDNQTVTRFTISCSGSAVTITAEEGKMVLMVADDVTAGLSAGIYAWDLKATDADGIVRYYVGGKFGVVPSVTE